MQQWVQQVASSTREFAAVLADGDPSAAVPSCPGWTLADLGDHLGGIHQWAMHAIREGTPDGDIQGAPSDRTGLARWYQEHAGRLIDVLSSTSADAPAWGFGPKPRTASFWARRQMHETDMHLWDAQVSQGSDQSIELRIEHERALDGIDEVLTVFFPRQVRLGRMPPLAHAVALDSGTGARFVLHGDGGDPPPDPPGTTVHGPADVLLLLLWKRIGLDDARLRISGDGAVARDVLGAKLTP